MSSQNLRVNAPTGLVILMAVQLVCAVFFVFDAAADYFENGGLGALTMHLAIETLATLSLLTAIAFEARFLNDLLQRKARLERHLDLARSEVHEVIVATFEAWKLSPAEADIAVVAAEALAILIFDRCRTG